MYENEEKCAEQAIGYPNRGAVVGGQAMNRTVSENIDAKIKSLQAEIARLEESKTTLAPLMGMKIRDIREAMNY